VRFCFPTTFYPPFSFGGDGIAVQRLARALARRGHEVTVIHDADAYVALKGSEPALEKSHDGVTVITLRSGLGALSPMLTQQMGRPFLNEGRLKRILADGEFDVINYHNASLIGGPAIFAFGGRTAKIYTAHEHWLVCPTHVLWRNNREVCTSRTCLTCQLAYRRPPQLWRYGSAMEQSLKYIDVFIALSNFSRDKHREFGFPRDMEVLPQFAADAEDVPSTAQDRPHAAPYFLIAGRLERSKGIREAIQAFARYQKADLLIAGSGREESALQQSAKNNSRINFLGQVSPGEMRRYYRHAIATIVPSLGFETFGMVIVESFRERTPVIARRIGPFPETIGISRGGELFDTTDDLVACLDHMQNDPAYATTLGEHGYTAYLERWCESRVVPQYLEIVGRTLDRVGSAQTTRGSIMTPERISARA
jgi:glycosyltransferase involved in cell wall biosynthesis